MRIQLLRIGDSAAHSAAYLDAILRIAAASPEAATWTREQYEAVLLNPERGSIWVALIGEGASERLVGFACARAAADEVELLNLAVAPSSRREGIGKRLLEHLLQEAGQQRAHKVFLEVRASNATALRFYEQRGFAVAGRRCGYYAAYGGGVEDALILALTLQTPA
jgi:ribosomal-protein-alanine N-acetyltransferase